MPFNSSDTESSLNVEFVRLVAKHERTLRGFVRSLMPQSQYVDDILQEVFVVAWKKFDQLQCNDDFARWVCTIAKFEVLNFRRKLARDKMVLSEDIIAMIADEGVEEDSVRKDQLNALERCVGELPEKRRKLVQQAYLPGVAISKVAAEINKSENAIYQSLYRIRQSLWNCVRSKLNAEAS